MIFCHICILKSIPLEDSQYQYGYWISSLGRQSNISVDIGSPYHRICWWNFFLITSARRFDRSIAFLCLYSRIHLWPTNSINPLLGSSRIASKIGMLRFDGYLTSFQLRSPCAGVRLIIGSKVLCMFCSEICTPVGRGGEKGGNVNLKTMHTEPLTQEIA